MCARFIVHVMFFCAACVPFLLTGCGKKATNGPAATAEASTVPAVDSTTATPAPAAIDEDMQQLAHKIEEGVSAGQPNTISDLIDWDVLMGRISAGVNAPEKGRKEFLTGLKSNSASFDQQLAQSLDGRGSFKLLRLRMKDGEPRALYRVALPDSGGVNYIDFLLVRSADGQTRIGDIFMFLVGEDFSKAVRRPFLAAMQHDSRGILDRLTGKENSFVKHFPAVTKLSHAVQGGNAAGAMAIYRSLPPEVQQEKMVLALRMRAAQSLGDDEYAAAIDDLRKRFGDDPSIRLILIDGYVLKQDYPKALECVDALDEALGGDPYLNTMRANVYLLMNDLPAAKIAAEKVTADLPELFDGQVLALTVALRDNRYDDVLASLALIESTFGMQLDVRGNAEFAEFVQSPQYQQWDAKHPAAAPPTADEAAPAPQ